MAPMKWDEPEMIIEGCIREKTGILSGYKGNPNADPIKLREASAPRHVAISLTGEPMLYPYLSDLIEGFHKRSFTTFLVSNGTLPEALSKLHEEPTQLYISLCAPEESTFLETCRPQIPDAWEKLNKTLDLLRSFSSRKVVRLTLVKGLNMDHLEGYAKMIEAASPDFVETKAYMHVGFSRLRLDYQNMPSHSEIQNFALNLAHSLGYKIIDECRDSRVVLLGESEQKRLIGAASSRR